MLDGGTIILLYRVASLESSLMSTFAVSRLCSCSTTTVTVTRHLHCLPTSPLCLQEPPEMKRDECPCVPAWWCLSASFCFHRHCLLGAWSTHVYRPFTSRHYNICTNSWLPSNWGTLEVVCLLTGLFSVAAFPKLYTATFIVKQWSDIETCLRCWINPRCTFRQVEWPPISVHT